MRYKITKWVGSRRLVVMNADDDGCSVTLTCAHHYGGNIIAPRQGFREMGVKEIYESC
jgi:hypothetical protein